MYAVYFDSTSWDWYLLSILSLKCGDNFKCGDIPIAVLLNFVLKMNSTL